MAKLIFVLGGARSGKSSFAEELASQYEGRVVYLATAAPLDEEMKDRIKRHRQSRPAHWETIEETRDLAGVIEREGGRASVILLDCLSIFVSNLLLDENFGPRDPQGKEGAVLAEVRRFCQGAHGAEATVIAVSNEVGCGLVPPYELGRAYRDILGRANQMVARYAHEVYYVVAGLPLELKNLSLQTRNKLLGER